MASLSALDRLKHTLKRVFSTPLTDIAGIHDSFTLRFLQVDILEERVDDLILKIQLRTSEIHDVSGTLKHAFVHTHTT